jgi:transposase
MKSENELNGKATMPRQRKSLDVRQLAVHDYERGDPIDDIAMRYDVTIGTVSTWAKKAELKRRAQGCTIKERPSPRELEIVEAVRAARERGGDPTLLEIGQMYGVKTRAGVHRIYHRWKHWRPVSPFKRGDRVRWKGVENGKVVVHDYEVVKPDIFQGKVRDLKTGRVTQISWHIGRNRAVKL